MPDLPAVSNLTDPLAPRQIRRVTMPLQMLVEYIDRRTAELTDARIHHAQVDESGQKLFLYIETAVGEPMPQTVDLNWEEILGLTPCAVCEKPCPVEDITICKHALPVVQAAVARGEFKCPSKMRSPVPKPGPQIRPAQEL